ncbi:helix-turn-helix transcriptional regulator [Salipiger marinus]|uniref:helix-turn-helix transcriptional regulator n=1 Tax=Salipiger marinus TaxID=555512 RepID=UPI000B7DF347|nr:helix-turn-helix transcriptional regulator [Salipiger marinus]
MQKLAEYRKQVGISQREFADLVGVHQSIISKLEAGRAQPGLSLAVRIQKATSDHVPVTVWLEEVCDADSIVSQEKGPQLISQQVAE